MVYLRMLRLKDQYLSLLAVFIFSLHFRLNIFFTFAWATGLFFLSLTAFMINELTDRNDTDLFTWNPNHISPKSKVNPAIFWSLFTIFTLIGLFICLNLKMIWWGLAVFIIGVLYSLKPVRFKNRFLLDALAQLAVWWTLPILGLLWKTNYFFPANLRLIFISSLFFWTLFFPYQLADYSADKKAGLKGTHTILGMENSLLLGITIGLASLALLPTIPQFLNFWVTKLGIISLIITLASYLIWLQKKNLPGQEAGMQKYVRCYKPLSRIITFVAALLLFF
ncbi:UbiA family prenyltransferase [Patescibacteria group bacterium]